MILLVISFKHGYYFKNNIISCELLIYIIITKNVATLN